MSEQAYENTDRELWRKGDGDGDGMSYYEPSISVTQLEYNPRCCRFPKSCSCTVYDPERVNDADLEPASTRGRMPAPSSPPEPVSTTNREGSGGDSVTPQNENLGDSQRLSCGGVS